MVRFLVRFCLIIVVLLVAGLVYALWPRTGDLRGFDADAVARLETALWRDYYAHDYKDLAVRLYELHREQYRFSPVDSAQLALAAGKAAQLFQPTTSREDAQIALPQLIRYYTLLRDNSGETFDPAKVAAIELDWWQLRREKVPPEQYSPVVARVTEELFGTTNPSIKKSALQRARMMRYRDDRRNGGMQADDWTHIESNLIESYRDLKAGVARTP